MSLKERLKRVMKLTGLWGLYCWAVYAMRNGRALMRSFGRSTIPFEYDGARVLFSLEDLYSRKFFAEFYRNSTIYEKDSLDALLSATNDGDTVFDVGANIGYYACILGARFPNSMVHAFEMSERNSRILRRNIELNRLNNVLVHNVAIAERSKTGHYIRNYLGSAVLELIDDSVSDTSDDIVDIPTISLDDFCNQNGLVPRIVKLDIEGGELNALNGMMRILSKNNVDLFVEVHRGRHDTSLTSIQKLLERVEYTYEPVKSNRRANSMIVARKKV